MERLLEVVNMAGNKPAMTGAAGGETFRVTRDTLIGDVIKNDPKAVGILTEHGMQCVGCHVATWETVEQAASEHGVDIDALLKQLNREG